MKRPDGRFTARDLRPELPRMVEQVGATSRDPYRRMNYELSMMCKDGHFARIGYGHYRIVE